MIWRTLKVTHYYVKYHSSLGLIGDGISKSSKLLFFVGPWLAGGLVLKLRWGTFNFWDWNSLSGLFRLIAIVQGRRRRRETNNLWAIRCKTTVGEELPPRRKDSEGWHSRLAQWDVLHSSQSSNGIQTAFWSSMKAHQENMQILLYQLSPRSQGVYFSSSNVCKPKPHRNETKTPFKKYVVVNLWHLKRNTQSSKCQLLRHLQSSLYVSRY